ncbi:outer dense fiber protein 3-like isoform X1 [Chiloscyllium plagiosum]|uniref:outer dense fiber protein 3-like isoform X1 n=2 Tax=Chiloscyllium plagiosum TaxID=36176 RepID=UPI001CB844C4|nr:outer dense fiber protein 3-like isoform X1 [Chiloscyllium plagiosum]
MKTFSPEGPVSLNVNMSSEWVGNWRPHRPRGPIAAFYSSPGPKYGLPGSIGYSQHDATKYKSPAYSFGVPHARFTVDSSPGPAYLIPSLLTRRGKDGAPAYSLYSRPKDNNPFQTPGPGTYSPEKAGKVAFSAAPSFSIAGRTKGFRTDQSPGPAAYVLPSVLGPNIVDKLSSANFSLSGRSKVGSFHEDFQKSRRHRKYPKKVVYQEAEGRILNNYHQ